MNDVLFVLLRFPVISLFRYMFFTMRKISFDLNPAHEVNVLCCSNVKSTLRCVFQYALLYLFRLLHLLSLPASGKLVTPYSDSSTIQNRFIFNEFCVRTSPVDFSFPLAQCCISCYVSRGVLKLNIRFNHLYYPFVCVMGDDLASSSLSSAFVHTLLIFFSRNVRVVLCLLFLHFLFSKIECCDFIR